MNKKINNSKLIIKNSHTPSDLLQILQSKKIPINGIFSIHDMPTKLTKRKGNYIFLISPPEHKQHGHWVALKVRKDKSLYFDSYGIPPPEEIVKISNTSNGIIFNKNQIQKINENNCGLFCIEFLNHKDFDFLSKFKIHQII